MWKKIDKVMKAGRLNKVTDKFLPDKKKKKKKKKK
tara:strand:+ start:631 stop:735 length:105 start_codon:yes stop_codon:yes gene_type:complete